MTNRSRGVPENARGIPATSPFWGMNDTDQQRFRAGWWANYNKKPKSKKAKPAWVTGWDEAEVMLKVPETDTRRSDAGN